MACGRSPGEERRHELFLVDEKVHGVERTFASPMTSLRSMGKEPALRIDISDYKRER